MRLNALLLCAALFTATSARAQSLPSGIIVLDGTSKACKAWKPGVARNVVFGKVTDQFGKPIVRAKIANESLPIGADGGMDVNWEPLHNNASTNEIGEFYLSLRGTLFAGITFSAYGYESETFAQATAAVSCLHVVLRAKPEIVTTTLDGAQIRAAQLGAEELGKHCDGLTKTECACVRDTSQTVVQLRPLEEAVLVLAYPGPCIGIVKDFGVALRVDRKTGKVLDSEFGLRVDRIWGMKE